ncbi:MAG: hypothetical protein WDN45_01740 [Caulobacteraceae bacterium]
MNSAPSRANQDERIFSYNHKSVSNVFTRAFQALGIEDIHFHDLRHEGTCRLFEAGLTHPARRSRHRPQGLEDAAPLSGDESVALVRQPREVVLFLFLTESEVSAINSLRYGQCAAPSPRDRSKVSKG